MALESIKRNAISASTPESESGCGCGSESEFGYESRGESSRRCDAMQCNNNYEL